MTGCGAAKQLGFLAAITGVGLVGFAGSLWWFKHNLVGSELYYWMWWVVAGYCSLGAAIQVRSSGVPGIVKGSFHDDRKDTPAPARRDVGPHVCKKSCSIRCSKGVSKFARSSKIVDTRPPTTSGAKTEGGLGVAHLRAPPLAEPRPQRYVGHHVRVDGHAGALPVRHGVVGHPVPVPGVQPDAQVRLT